MRRFAAFSLILALLAALLLSPAAAQETTEPTVLYDGAAASTLAATLACWPANTTRAWSSSCKARRLGTLRQVEYYNNVSDAGGLPEGESLSVDITGLSIPADDWAEVRLELLYAWCPVSSDVHVGRVGRFEARVSWDGGETWSGEAAPMLSHRLADSGAISSGRQVFLFRVTSGDLAALAPAGAVIDRVRIRPFGDYPIHYGAFRLQQVRALGWSDAQSVSDPAPAPAPIPMDPALMRQIAVDRMYRIVDLPWTMPGTEDMITYNSNGYQDEAHTQYYKPDLLYLGPAYSRIIDSTWQMFRASVDAGVYTGGVTDSTVTGMDCIKIVSNALVTVSNAAHHTWIYAPLDPRLLLLGGVVDRTGGAGTASVIADQGDQAIMRGYAELLPGDYILSQHNGNRSGHVRLCTGETRVVYTDGGLIDPAASTVTVTETGGSIWYYFRSPSGDVLSVDTHDPAKWLSTHPGYTLLYGTSCRRDRVYTFAQLLNDLYLAWRPEEYELGQVNGLSLETQVDGDGDTIPRDGFFATLACNWPMAGLTLELTGETGSTLYRSEQLLPAGSYETLVSDPELDGTLTALTPGRYTLTLDVSAGPVTEVGGEAPVTRAAEVSLTLPLPGDLTGDFKVSGKDVVLLQRFLAGGYGVEPDADRADLNGDGKVNAKDVVLLQRYLVGGYGVDLS